jgi:hypothetical protein
MKIKPEEAGPIIDPEPAIEALEEQEWQAE